MDKILETLMEDNVELVFSLDDYLSTNHPLSDKIAKIISNLTDEEIQGYCSIQDMRLHNQDSDLFNIRKKAFTNMINKTVNEQKIKYLFENDEMPMPYNLIDKSLFDEDFLIDINKFDIDNMRFINKDYSYSVLQSRPEKNSMYFALIELNRLKNQATIKLRLDPFMKKLNSEYSAMMYKMRIYGNPFSWDEINHLDGPIRLKWQDENYDYQNREFTEMIWKKVDDEVHFICEEMPRKEDLNIRGSRYFHSIYLPEKEKIIHADAAIRIYSNEEFDIRMNDHVSKTGKIGKRIKIFRADGEIDRQDWSNLVIAFYYMNDDISEYYRQQK